MYSRPNDSHKTPQNGSITYLNHSFSKSRHVLRTTLAGTDKPGGNEKNTKIFQDRENRYRTEPYVLRRWQILIEFRMQIVGATDKTNTLYMVQRQGATMIG